MTTRLTYAPSSGARIPNLDPFFGPDAPPLPDPEAIPDGMLQNPTILYAMQILDDVVVDGSPDVFLDMNTIVYDDPTNRNRRFQPDIYIAFGVDAATVLRRNGYVIWEVGKPPDFALEVASETTASNDTGWKRERYAAVGIREYWRFDPTGGALYGRCLAGEYLENGRYRAFRINTDADGTTWGYSPLLHLNLRCHQGRLELQDPVTGAILSNRRGERQAREIAQAAVRERDELIAEQQAAVRERDELIAEQQARLAEQSARIAELEARMRQPDDASE